MTNVSAPLDRLAELAHGWNTLTLSVEAPDRVPGWDAIVLTAASPKQATLYECRVAQAATRGLIPSRTRCLVVPDPGGRRIGSGGATLNALRWLAESLPARQLAGLRVLLVHAGGDSRRLPWANVFGKPFIPVPLLADADRPVPTLFDQLLAITAPVALNLPRGGLLSVTGDVLPLFPSSGLASPADGAVVVTKPVSVDVASRHGVIVADRANHVTRLLQKPSLERLQDCSALVGGGAALVDTGIYLFTGAAFSALLNLAAAGTDLVETLAASGTELSLYEDIAAALVPAHRAELSRTPWLARLVQSLGRHALEQRRYDELEFLHFGTSAEFLDHLRGQWFGELPTRVLSECGPGVSASARCYGSSLGADSRVGSDSLVLDSRLTGVCEIGNRCVVLNLDAEDEPLDVPANSCLWQLPVSDDQLQDAVVDVCCGVDDNPKTTLAEATFCNHSLTDWLAEHRAQPQDLWPAAAAAGTLWTAKLFPVRAQQSGLHLVSWMLDPRPASPALAEEWRQADRLSLADLHEATDVGRLIERQRERRAALVLRALRHARDGHLDCNVASLAAQLASPQLRQRASALVGQSRRAPPGGHSVPVSRKCQIQSDLLLVAGRREESAEMSGRAFAAVQTEVREAMRPHAPSPVLDLGPGTLARAELPVRFDIAGGWSDTPPYCLERPAGVLNLAMRLGGGLPVGAEAEALAEPVWELVLTDTGRSARISSSPEAGRIGDLADPFTLLRTALVLCGYGSAAGISQGVRLRSWASVPRGSGLGTSSILGAALVTALQRLAGRASDTTVVSEMVLTLEQMMTTGGGWQDQIGGLVPGAKFISTVPVRPLRVVVEPVPILPEVAAELARRLVIAFSGQDRLAKNVLQMVVTRYLQRDRQVIRAIGGLVALARQARAALAMGELDDLGHVLREVWHLHQMLDPHCSNPAVDAIFREVDGLASGYKLAGAGGGGFMGILARDASAADTIRAGLARVGNGVTVYDWALA